MEPRTAADRLPVRIKVYGGALSLLSPGTDWRVERVTEHHAPTGLVGEPMPEWSIIDLVPADAAAPYRDALERLVAADMEKDVGEWVKVLDEARELLRREVGELPCTFRRGYGEPCGKPESDRSVHSPEDERKQPGTHIWRHEVKR